MERAAAESGLGDTDTLPFTTGDTTNEIVTDLGVDSVRKTKHSHDDITHVLCVLIASDARQTVARGASESSKLQSMSYRKLREMHIGFGSVDGLTAELAVHLLIGDSLVVHVRITILEDAVQVSCNRLQESRTARSRTAENNQHLATFNEAVEVAEDLNLLLASAGHRTEQGTN